MSQLAYVCGISHDTSVGEQNYEVAIKAVVEWEKRQVKGDEK